MNKRKILRIIIYILIIIYIVKTNINTNKQYNEYLKINNLNNTKLNHERFCEDNGYIFFD